MNNAAILLEKGKIIAQVTSVDTSFDINLVSQSNGSTDSETWIDSFDLRHLTEEQAAQVRNLIRNYKHLFSQSQLDLGRASGVKHHIDTWSAAPVKSRSYRYSPSEKEIIERESRQNGGSRYSQRRNPLPVLEDVLQSLQGAKYFSTLDLRSGFYQVPLSAEEREKTAFTTGQRLMHFNVLPMGLCNNPAWIRQNLQPSSVTLQEPLTSFLDIYLKSSPKKRRRKEKKSIKKQVMQRVILLLMHICIVHACEKYSFVKEQDVEFKDHVISTMTTPYVELCWDKCVWIMNCFSINVRVNSFGMFECDLNNSSKKASPGSLVPTQGSQYHQMGNTKECDRNGCTLIKEDLGGGWYRINDAAVKIIHENKTWIDARAHCQSQGADLASIKTNYENLFIIDMFLKSMTSEGNNIALPGNDLPGLLKYWVLDGTDGDVVLKGAPSPRYEVVDGEKALYFPGFKGYAEVPAVVMSPEGYTFMLWFKPANQSIVQLEEVYSDWSDGQERFYLTLSRVGSEAVCLRVKKEEGDTVDAAWAKQQSYICLLLEKADSFDKSTIYQRLTLESFNVSIGLWIGLNAMNDTSTFKWSDGTNTKTMVPPVQFEDSPISYWPRCAAVARDGKWMIKICKDLSSYVCRKPFP
ncbi:uncharacterized protein LOC116307875 [Actinia tenebrosa]|uniref:Uncharacterized protein LOC116307875 n=1 Tax=Actinia tenebrosa TaxID=6105 RepID=A0A6P8J8C3_ACTTE|nr:uncharacterized protein LOC116307875 [Actinia tenebrosa]